MEKMLNLLVELLSTEIKYADHLAKYWREFPASDDKEENEYEIAFKHGYAIGVGYAVNMIKKHLFPDKQ